MLRLLVSGSRWATPEQHGQLVASALLAVCRRDAGVLAHGDAAGVDRIAAAVAETIPGWKAYPVPALWAGCDLTVPVDLGGCPDWPHRKRRRDGASYCPRAGWRRNQRLVDLTPRADVVVTFPDQRRDSGTKDFIRRARRAGYDPQVREIEVVIPRG
jgi:hypothetical protein